MAQRGLQIDHDLCVLNCLICERLIFRNDLVDHLTLREHGSLKKDAKIHQTLEDEMDSNGPPDGHWCENADDNILKNLAYPIREVPIDPLFAVKIHHASICLVPTCRHVAIWSKSNHKIKEHVRLMSGDPAHISFWNKLQRRESKWRDGKCQALTDKREEGGAVFIEVTVTEPSTTPPVANPRTETLLQAHKLSAELGKGKSINDRRKAAVGTRPTLPAMLSDFEAALKWERLLRNPTFKCFDFKQLLLLVRLPDESLEAPIFETEEQLEHWTNGNEQYFGVQFKTVEFAMEKKMGGTLLVALNGRWVGVVGGDELLEFFADARPLVSTAAATTPAVYGP